MLLSTDDLFSVTPSRRRIELVSYKPFIFTSSFPISDNQKLLLSILSLGDIPVITTTSYMIDNLFLSDIHGYWRCPYILVLRTQNQNHVESIALVDDFQQRQEVWLRFSLLLNNEITCSAIHRYQVKIDNAIMHLIHVYQSCSRFIYLYKLKIIPKDNLVIATNFAHGIFCLDQFDFCECLSQSYIFYKKC